MYDDLSHRLYRHLVRVLERDPNHGDPERARQVLLAACEANTAVA